MEEPRLLLGVTLHAERRSRHACLLATLVGIALAWGCSDTVTCTGIGCGPSLTVVVNLAVAGDHDLTVTVDDIETICRVDDGYVIDGCSSDRVAVRNEERGRFSIESNSTPRSVRVVASRDGQTLASAEASPEYTIVEYPNGPECGECRSASTETLRLE